MFNYIAAGVSEKCYICNVFFMVLDLRLTRLVAVRQSIFFMSLLLFQCDAEL